MYDSLLKDCRDNLVYEAMNCSAAANKRAEAAYRLACEIAKNGGDPRPQIKEVEDILYGRM